MRSSTAWLRAWMGAWMRDWMRVAMEVPRRDRVRRGRSADGEEQDQGNQRKTPHLWVPCEVGGETPEPNQCIVLRGRRD